MSLGSFELTLLPINVKTKFGEIGGFILHSPAKASGGGFGIHPAAGTSMMHGSPLAQRVPIFLYQTPDEVDNAVFEFLKDRNTPVYYLDPTGEVEWTGHGPKIGYQWPDKSQRCDAEVTFRATMRKEDARR